MTCSEYDCGKPVQARGMCSKHYSRWRRLDAAPAYRQCSIQGCRKPKAMRDWCHMHYSRWKRYGDPNHPVRQKRAARTGYVQKRYRNIWVNGGVVQEHRYVMSQALGRELEEWETVHHINGDTLDNSLENLQLRQGQHGRGVVMACADCGSHRIEPVPISDPAVKP